ncbi:MAG TPA: hypothetical protein VFY96_15350 [Candidatus Binatia bacterium]|nr:hypothetical protein [Candidatus Binatia bacterium]
MPQRGWQQFETVKDVIEGELGDEPYLFGDWFKAADVMIGRCSSGSECGVSHPGGPSWKPTSIVSSPAQRQ